MDKRAAPRFPVTLDVVVTFPGNEHRVCTIRDYCTNGMYLLCIGEAASKGDPLDIEFSNPLKPKEPRYRLKGRVARVAENGFGVAFTEQNPVAVAALSQLAESQAAASRQSAVSSGQQESVAREVVDDAIGECRERIADSLTEALKIFFTRANDTLFNKAGDAKNNEQQSIYFGAMNELRRAQVMIGQTFVERLNEVFQVLTVSGYQSPYTQRESQSSDELSLIDSDDLDRWLAVRAMAAKLEGQLGESLEALEMRCEMISSNPITLENNPVGPFIITSIFREALDTLVLEEAARTTLFAVMEGVLHERLLKLYDELNARMSTRGILSEYKKKLEVVRPPAGGSSAGVSATSVDDEPGSVSIEAAADYAGAVPAAPAQQPGAAAFTSSAPPSASTTTTQSNPLDAAQAATPVTNPITYTRPGVVQARSERLPASMYQGVQELMHLQQAAVTGDNAEQAMPANYYSSGEVMQALGHLEQAVALIDRETISALDHVHYLAQSLNEVIGREGKVLKEGDQEKVTYVGGLLSSILQDQLVPQHAKPWFSTLEIPLLKAGLLDGSLVEDEDHPARQLLNRLESIGDRLQGDDSEGAEAVRQRIEAIIGTVRENVENDENVFAKALDELEFVAEEVTESYEENVAKLIAELEKETALNRARQKILEDLNHRLGQREVPKVILELLDKGWKNLLLRTYLKSGGDSNAYQTYLNVIDQLYARLMETMPYSKSASMTDEALQEWLERMLSIVAEDEATNAGLLGTIGMLLAGDSTEGVSTQYVPALVSKMLSKEHHAEADKPEGVSDDIWQLMLLDASEVQDGEVFLFRNTEEEQQAHLVWHDETEHRYVFVDNVGYKLLDKELGELANLFYQGKLSRLDEKSLSVTERATYHFLQSLHSQLAYQAQHDELTGLLNRKAFEKELEEAFGEAKLGAVTHVLGYIDLDRFNVINTTCGHADGDILLTRVAKVLQDSLGEGAVLSRLGGDEFGILLKSCSRTNGLKMITEVHDAIRGLQYVCENNEFKVTASIGLAEINELSDSSGRLLSAVDAATFTAKDMGRDNIQIYNAENERISSRRNILDWVGRINVLFDKNLIQLRCQKIQPLHATVNSLPHYEVLLDVKDEEGNTVPLDEFIVAAERYNRIIDIDTWVVDYVLNWMDERKDKLDRLNAVSINLSGSSLGNRKFMEHIEQRLSRPGFPAEKVCFEITESIAINNLDNASRFMRKIKDTGCHFSLDDFGTGTSSYSYLKSLPIDILKIDGTFVKDIATNSHDYAMVKSINEIGHAMGKSTVAEYVESEFAYEALKQIGIDYVQGFGVEKPIPLYKLFG